MFSMKMVQNVLITVALFATVVAGQEAALPNGTVELVVHAPTGKPVRDANLRICYFESRSRNSKESVLRVKTDANGLARFPWQAGVIRLRVEAKGIGFGATGTFELSEKGTARPHLTPLFPFGTIAGMVPPELVQPGVSIHLREWSEGTERKAAVDDKGKFLVEDLQPGRWKLVLRKEKEAVSVWNPW